MKTKLWLILIPVFSPFVKPQSTGGVGINTMNPHPSSVLDITSSDKGVLVPRLTTAAANDLANSAAEGLIIFDQDQKLFLGWDGTKWVNFGTNPASARTDQSFASWEVSGIYNYGNNLFPASQLLNEVIISATLDRGTNLGTSGTAINDAWGATGWPDTVENAILEDKLITLKMIFAPNKTISFSRISAHALRISPTGPTHTQYQYSIDGGNNFQNLGSPISLPTSTITTDHFIQEISLRLFPELQIINTTQVPILYFRIINYGATSNLGRWYLADSTGFDFQLVGDIIN